MNGHQLHIICSCSLRHVASTLLLISLCFAGCATLERHDDSVRIRTESQERYWNGIGALSARDGRTLRGTVVEVQIGPGKERPEVLDTLLVFLDASADDRAENYQRIRLLDVDIVVPGPVIRPNQSGHDSMDIESYNATSFAPMLRRVPVRYLRDYGIRPPNVSDSAWSVYKQTHCDCAPLGIGPIDISLTCPDRIYHWYFVEARLAYAGLTDEMPNAGLPSIDGAAGLRLGSNGTLGIGIGMSGFLMMTALGAADTLPPAQLLAHFRYQSPGSVTNFLGICLKPFTYVDVGMAPESPSFDLMKINLTSRSTCSCGQTLSDLEASGQLHGVDLSMPISYGFGAGIDLPICSLMDLSFDVGWRSLAYGRKVNLGGWMIPSCIRHNLLFFRLGVTL